MPSLNTKLASAPNTQTNYVLKATSSTTIGNSIIQDNGSTATVGGALTATGQVEGTIINSTSNAFRLSGNNALSLVTLNSQSVVKINAAGFWGVQLVGANDSGIVINNTGNVGIGASNITGKLMVYQGSAGNVFQSIVSNQGGSTRVGINLNPSMNESDAAAYQAQSAIYATDYNYSANIIFATKTEGAYGNSLTERMRITSSGHLLIGNSTDLTFFGGWDSGVTRIGTGGLLFSYRDNDDNFMISQNYYINSAGNDVRVSAGGASNIYMADGEMYFRTAANGTAGSTLSWRNPLLLKNSGRVLVNTTTDRAYTFQVNGDVTSYACEIRQSNDAPNYDLLTLTHEATSGNRRMVIFNAGGYGTVGTIISTNSSTTYNTNSDYRLKEDLKEVDGLAKVSAIKVYDFKWKIEDARMDGVLAHELAEVLPYAVYGDKDGVDEDGKPIMQGVDYSKIVPVLVKAIQEQQAQIEELKALINK